MNLLTSKLFFVAAYGLLGLSCIRAAAGLSQPSFVVYLSRTRWLAHFVVASAALLLMVYILTGSQVLLCAAAISTLFFVWRNNFTQRPSAILLSLSVSVLVLSLVWWRFCDSPVHAIPLTFFVVSFAAIFFGLQPTTESRTLPLYFIYVVFSAAGLALLVDLSAFRPGQSAIVFLVHHWGAFIGPALHIKAGLTPFYDVPLQYGLGPTLVLASICKGSDCWSGAHAIFASCHLIEALLILSMVLSSVRRGWPWVVTTSLVVFSATFLWPGFPAEGNLLIATPSTGGVRFLPVAIVAWLFYFERPVAATMSLPIALLWSPESAAMALMVYGFCGTQHFGFLKAVTICGVVLGSCAATLVLVHRLIYDVWIDPGAFFEYVVHVPGPLPIDPLSDILLLAIVLLLGGWLVFNPAADLRDRRRDMAAIALLFASTSYALGRSHPNNICNLAPFFILVAFRAIDRMSDEAALLREVTRLALAVFVAALAFSPWNVVPWDGPIVTDIHKVVSGFQSQEPEVTKLRQKILAHSSPGLGIADFGPHFSRHPSETIVWTPMDPSSLWAYVPDDRRKLYVQRSAQRLNRSGWAIFADSQKFLLDDLMASYTVHQLQRFNGAKPKDAYTLACFDPKGDVATKAVLSVARCPASEPFDGSHAVSNQDRLKMGQNILPRAR